MKEVLLTLYTVKLNRLLQVMEVAEAVAPPSTIKFKASTFRLFVTFLLYIYELSLFLFSIMIPIGHMFLKLNFQQNRTFLLFHILEMFSAWSK